MKLNRGCDRWRIPEFVNIDRVRLPGTVDPDLICDAAALPCPDLSVSEIYMGHLLEHFDRPGANTLLQECCRVLRDSGWMYVVVPDIRRALALHEAGELTEDELQGAVFGARTRREQDHCQVFTETLLVATLQQHFEVVVGLAINDCPHIVSVAGWQAAAFAARPFRKEAGNA